MQILGTLERGMVQWVVKWRKGEIDRGQRGDLGQEATRASEREWERLFGMWCDGFKKSFGDGSRGEEKGQRGWQVNFKILENESGRVIAMQTWQFICTTTFNPYNPVSPSTLLNFSEMKPFLNQMASISHTVKAQRILWHQLSQKSSKYSLSYQISPSTNSGVLISQGNKIETTLNVNGIDICCRVWYSSAQLPQVQGQKQTAQQIHLRKYSTSTLGSFSEAKGCQSRRNSVHSLFDEQGDATIISDSSQSVGEDQEAEIIEVQSEDEMDSQEEQFEEILCQSSISLSSFQQALSHFQSTNPSIYQILH